MMKHKYCVYRFKDKNDIIVYVGRSIDLRRRFLCHDQLNDNIKTIEFIECISEAEMLWKEIYYINLYKNKFTTNTSSLGQGSVTKLDLKDEWIMYDKRSICQSLKYPEDYNVVNYYKNNLNLISLASKYNYKDIIHIFDHYKMNNIGKDKYNLSYHWFLKDLDNQLKIKAHLCNYFTNKAKIKNDCLHFLWTTFPDCKDLIKGKGYTKGFVNIYDNIQPNRDKNFVAFIANDFLDSTQIECFKNNGMDITSDQFATAEIVSFILQTAAYYGDPITIYIPSNRMRSLLEKWIKENSND